jgi:hypothetical protein
MVNPCWLYALASIGVGLTIWGWYVAAKQNAESDEQAKILRDIRAALPGPSSGQVHNLAPLDAAALKTRVASLTLRMRTFAAGVDSSRARLFAPGQMDHQKLIQHSADAQAEYRGQLWPEAIALRDEMARRVGLLKPYPSDHRSVAIDYGMLAGVSPINEAANYLEELARKLS